MTAWPIALADVEAAGGCDPTSPRLRCDTLARILTGDL